MLVLCQVLCVLLPSYTVRFIVTSNSTSVSNKVIIISALFVSASARSLAINEPFWVLIIIANILCFRQGEPSSCGLRSVIVVVVDDDDVVSLLLLCLTMTFQCS